MIGKRVARRLGGSWAEASVSTPLQGIGNSGNQGHQEVSAVVSMPG